MIVGDTIPERCLRYKLNLEYSLAGSDDLVFKIVWSNSVIFYEQT
jgi:hypothetical protein